MRERACPRRERQELACWAAGARHEKALHHPFHEPRGRLFPCRLAADAQGDEEQRQASLPRALPSEARARARTCARARIPRKKKRCPIRVPLSLSGASAEARVWATASEEPREQVSEKALVQISGRGPAGEEQRGAKKARHRHQTTALPLARIQAPAQAQAQVRARVRVRTLRTQSPSQARKQPRARARKSAHHLSRFRELAAQAGEGRAEEEEDTRRRQEWDAGEQGEEDTRVKLGAGPLSLQAGERAPGVPAQDDRSAGVAG